MEWLFENWFVVVGVVVILVSAGFASYKFLGLPTKDQVAKIKEWLLFAVTEAESELGSQTGILKLRMVYDLFVARFPMAAKAISFATFSYWVDEALDEMRELLASNEAIKEIIQG